MLSVDLMSLWNAVCSVLLCISVRKRTHPLVEIRPMRVAGEFHLSRRIFLSLTKLTDLTEPFCALSRTHRTPPAYREHRGLSTKISCNVLWYRLTQCLCEMLCVLSFCVNLWEREHWRIVGGVFSLTEHTDLTEPCCAQFWSYRTPSAYRIHRTFQLLSLLIRDITKPTSFL